VSLTPYIEISCRLTCCSRRLTRSLVVGQTRDLRRVADAIEGIERMNRGPLRLGRRGVPPA
jgi:hypothetical protein